jgi:hypothetical protein
MEARARWQRELSAEAASRGWESCAIQTPQLLPQGQTLVDVDPVYLESAGRVTARRGRGVRRRFRG